jgi:hypothetical protein
MALEQMGVPFTYLSTQRLREPGLLDRFDVVVFPHVSSAPVAGGERPPDGRPGDPVARLGPSTPSLAGSPDSTGDLRPGLGYDGLAALQRFVARGGLLVTEGNSARCRSRWASRRRCRCRRRRASWRAGATGARAGRRAHAPGALRLRRADVPVYFNQAPVFAVAGGAAGAGNQGGPQRDTLLQNRPDPALLREADAARPRVLVRFAPQADSLLVAGLLENGAELAGRPAVGRRPARPRPRPAVRHPPHVARGDAGHVRAWSSTPSRTGTRST